MRDEIMGAQEEANRLHELRQGAVSELSRLRYAEEELEQVVMAHSTQFEECNFANELVAHYDCSSLKTVKDLYFNYNSPYWSLTFDWCHFFRSLEH